MKALRVAMLLAVAAALTACATSGRLARPRSAETAARPGAPPEYDFLVGRENELAGHLAEALAAYRRALRKDPESAYLHQKVAELLARQGSVAEAIGYAERAYRLDPKNPQTRIFLGQLYRLRHDATAAEKVLTTSQGDPIDEDAAILLYAIYSEAGRNQDAVRIGQWLVQQDPSSLRGYFALAGAFEQMKRPKDAEAALRDALKKHPGNLTVYSALARMRRARGDRKGEIEIYREALRKHPGHYSTLVALADAQIALGDLDAARKTLVQVAAQHPDDLRSLARLGFLEIEAKQFPAAAKHLGRALQVDPKQWEVAYFLGVVQRRLGQFDAAKQVLGRIPEDADRYADARAQLAAIAEHEGDYAEALRQAEAARAKAPSRELDLYVASLRAKAGDSKGAIDFLKGLLAKSPKDPELLYNLGVVYGEGGDEAQAVDTMQRVLKLDPDHAGALNYIGYTWAEHGVHLDQAEAMIQKALKQRPKDGYITDSLGWVYYQRARPLIHGGQTAAGRVLARRAIEKLRKAQELTGGDPVISEHLGDVYLLLDEKHRAVEMYEKAVSLNPRAGEQPNLREKLDRLRKELGRR